MKDLYIQPDWPAPSCIKAFTTLRQSNIGLRQLETSPEQAKAGNINRPLLKKTFNLLHDPIWILQNHTSIALEAKAENDGKIADALFTNKNQTVCAILTADCLPVLLCDRQGQHVAAIHAGWRGLANDVIESTLRALNLPPGDVVAWLGPAIGPEKFVVRKDVYDIFTQKHAEATVCFESVSAEQWLADIYQLARLRLNKQGINAIYGGGLCTHTDQERFFSFRRDGKILGNIVSVIWINH